MDISLRKITVDDIANTAGVTKSTVSRHFDRDSVKESTRERIREIVRGYNYEPNTFAGLKAKESSVTGVVLPTFNSEVSSRVVTSIGRYLRGQGYETPIKDSDHSVNLRLESIQELTILRVGGIILSVITITEAHKSLIQESPMPVVMAAQEHGGGIFIVHDDYGAGKATGVRMGRAAPTRVGYVGVSGFDVAVGLNRKQGMMNDLKEYGVKNMITTTDDYSYTSGIRMAERILDQGLVDIIICATDRLASGACHVLGKRGLKIPEDVSVTGFGRYNESILLEPELITLRFGSYGLGYLGAETILKMIHREPVSKKQVMDYRIIESRNVKR